MSRKKDKNTKSFFYVLRFKKVVNEIKKATAHIYRSKRNIPVFLGTTEYVFSLNDKSKTHEEKVCRFLKNQKHIASNHEINKNFTAVSV